MAGRHADELAVHRPALVGGGDGAVGRQFLNRLPHLNRRDSGVHWLAKCDANRIRKFLRPLPQDLAAPKAENTSPYVIETNRNYWRGSALENLLEAAMKRQQEAGSRYAAFRENTNGITLR